MTVEQRIRRCILIERMRVHKEYCEKLGLEDISVFRGKRTGEEGEKKC